MKKLALKIMALENKLGNDKKILSLVTKSGLTAKELEILLKTPEPGRPSRIYNHSTSRREIAFGIVADSHIGQEKFDEALFESAGKVFRKNKIKRVYHAGDILEGMSGREGQVYELSHIGFQNQIEEAERLMKKYWHGFEVFGINGNHDLWYKKKNNGGMDVGKELQLRVPNYTHLGDEEADIQLAPKVLMKLFHPSDGTAYAVSYKMQKAMEAFEGGHKPQILVEGHYHKALYMFNRNIHGIEGGTLCGQTSWMRGKKIPAHKGFWIVRLQLGKEGISKFNPTFYPAYD
jgi:UDP-2,3-diacylglucosamine pyrophosphatase LpxH